MILPDLNLLLYAYQTDSPWNHDAKRWWVQRLSGPESVGLSWVVMLGFVRLSTNRRVFTTPLSIDQACGFVESWLARAVVEVLHPGPRHARLLFGFLRAEGHGGNLTTHAHLAALAVEHGAILHTADPDFSRFAGVKWANPLAVKEH